MTQLSQVCEGSQTYSVSHVYDDYVAYLNYGERCVVMRVPFLLIILHRFRLGWSVLFSHHTQMKFHSLLASAEGRSVQGFTHFCHLHWVIRNLFHTGSASFHAERFLHTHERCPFKRFVMPLCCQVKCTTGLAHYSTCAPFFRVPAHWSACFHCFTIFGVFPLCNSTAIRLTVFPHANVLISFVN